MHSTEVNSSTPNEVGDKVVIQFDNLNLSEEVRVNLIFLGWNISKPVYNKKNTHFTKTYSKKI